MLSEKEILKSAMMKLLMQVNEPSSNYRKCRDHRGKREWLARLTNSLTACQRASPLCTDYTRHVHVHDKLNIWNSMNNQCKQWLPEMLFCQQSRRTKRQLTTSNIILSSNSTASTEQTFQMPTQFVLVKQGDRHGTSVECQRCKDRG